MHRCLFWDGGRHKKTAKKKALSQDRGEGRAGAGRAAPCGDCSLTHWVIFLTKHVFYTVKFIKTHAVRGNNTPKYDIVLHNIAQYMTKHHIIA